MTKDPRGLLKMSAALMINRGSLSCSFHDGSEWEMIKSVMVHLGFEMKFIHVALAPGDTAQAIDNIIPFPLPGKVRAA